MEFTALIQIATNLTVSKLNIPQKAVYHFFLTKPSTQQYIFKMVVSAAKQFSTKLIVLKFIIPQESNDVILSLI